MKGHDIRLVSILAGISTAALRSRFPGHADIVRVMPNTPVGVGQGVCALYADERTSDAAREQVEALMQPLGLAEWLKDETQFRSEEHTSELQSLMRISYAVFCLKKKNDK